MWTLTYPQSTSYNNIGETERRPVNVRSLSIFNLDLIQRQTEREREEETHKHISIYAHVDIDLYTEYMFMWTLTYIQISSY